MNKINYDKQNIPQSCIHPTQDGPSPIGKEGTANEQCTSQIENTKQTTRGQVRQKKEGICQLKIYMVHIDTLVRLASNRCRHYWQFYTFSHRL